MAIFTGIKLNPRIKVSYTAQPCRRLCLPIHQIIMAKLLRKECWKFMQGTIDETIAFINQEGLKSYLFIFYI